jgi:hypothetical protein
MEVVQGTRLIFTKYWKLLIFYLKY